MHYTAKRYREKTMIAINAFNELIKNNFDKIDNNVYANNSLIT